MLAFQPRQKETRARWSCWGGQEVGTPLSAAGPMEVGDWSACFRSRCLQVQEEKHQAHLLALPALETPLHPQAGRDSPSLPLPTYAQH